MSKRYTLTPSGVPVLEPSLTKWAQWFETANRKVGDDRRKVGDVDIHVSTVFLGLDYSFGGETPVLWETMVFGGPLDQEQERCSGSREQAEAMHHAMVHKAFNAITP